MGDNPRDWSSINTPPPSSLVVFMYNIVGVSWNANKNNFNTFCSFFFVLKKWFEMYINWHHAIGFKVMSMGRNGSSLAWMTTTWILDNRLRQSTIYRRKDLHFIVKDFGNLKRYWSPQERVTTNNCMLSGWIGQINLIHG